MAVVGIDKDFEILEGDAIQPYINDMEAEDSGAMEVAFFHITCTRSRCFGCAALTAIGMPGDEAHIAVVKIGKRPRCFLIVFAVQFGPEKILTTCLWCGCHNRRRMLQQQARLKVRFHRLQEHCACRTMLFDIAQHVARPIIHGDYTPVY